MKRAHHDNKSAARRRASRSGPVGGRPTKFRPEYVEVAATLAKNGATDADVAAALGVAIRTVWRWQAEHVAFCQALVVPPGAPDDRVERSLFQRSVGYTFDSEKVFQHNGQPVRVPVTEHIPPDPGAAMKWLTNRRPDRWRDRQSLEHTGKDGKDLVPESTSHRDVARAVLDILREAELAPTEDAPVDEADAVEDACSDDDLAALAAVDVQHPRIEEALKTARRIDESKALPPAPRVRVFNPTTGRLE